MTATAIDAKKYGRLLSRALPRVIETEEQNDEVLAGVEELLAKGDARSAEEVELTKLLVALVEAFEARRYELEPSTPLERLKALMEENGLRQADLLDVFGSRGIASEVLGGKRRISRGHAAALGERFG